MVALVYLMASRQKHDGHSPTRRLLSLISSWSLLSVVRRCLPVVKKYRITLDIGQYKSSGVVANTPTLILISSFLKVAMQRRWIVH